MSEIRYRIVWSETAKESLDSIQDKVSKRAIIKRVEKLSENPELQGKPLRGELSGLRCVRAAGQRYRVIYEVESKKVFVYIIAVGIRREGDTSDVYRILKKKKV